MDLLHSFTFDRRLTIAASIVSRTQAAIARCLGKVSEISAVTVGVRGQSIAH